MSINFFTNSPIELLAQIGDYAFDANEVQDLASYLTFLPPGDGEKVLMKIKRDPPIEYARLISHILAQHRSNFDLMPEETRALFRSQFIQRSVKSLHLSVFSCSETELENMLKLVKDFPNINDIDLSGAVRGITDRSIELVVRNLPQLEYIDLTNSNELTGRTKDTLLQLPKLKRANLSGTYYLARIFPAHLQAKN